LAIRIDNYQASVISIQLRVRYIRYCIWYVINI